MVRHIIKIPMDYFNVFLLEKTEGAPQKTGKITIK